MSKSHDDNQRDLKQLYETQRRLEDQLQEQTKVMSEGGYRREDGTVRLLDAKSRQELAGAIEQTKVELNNVEKRARELLKHDQRLQEADQASAAKHLVLKLHRPEEVQQTLEQSREGLELKFQKQTEALQEVKDVDRRRELTEQANQTRLELKNVEDNLRELKRDRTIDR